MADLKNKNNFENGQGNKQEKNAGQREQGQAKNASWSNEKNLEQGKKAGSNNESNHAGQAGKNQGKQGKSQNLNDEDDYNDEY